MAAKPYTLSAQVTLPPDDGQPVSIRDLIASGSFTHKVELELVMDAAGDEAVSFGSIPSTGAKLVLVEYPVTTSTDAPITVTINGANNGIPISAGGGILLSSPSPTGGGIVSMSINHTTTGVVKVTLLA
jgi:hypothetical protein